jgi:carboxymethylenebutenolidase
MRITLPSGTAAEIARPDGAAESGRGLVLCPDIMGLRPLFDEHCARLARDQGLVVVAPEPFPGLEDKPLDWRLQHAGEVMDAQRLGDIVDAAAATGQPTVGIIGFCMGGMYALKAAGTGRFDRAVAFYGMVRVPEDWRGDELREPLETATDACPTLAIFGTADPYTPAADIEALRQAWKDRPDCDVVVYQDAEHGFVHDADRPAHRAADAADAWSRVLRFLGVAPATTDTAADDDSPL